MGEDFSLKKKKTTCDPEYFTLHKREKVLVDTKPVKKLLLQWAIDMALVGIILGGIVGGISALVIVQYSSLAVGIFAWLLATLIVTTIGVLAAWMRYSKRNYWITNQRIVCKTGFVGETLTFIPITKISNVALHTSLIGRLFGHKNIIVIAGEIHREETLEAIPNPVENQDLILKLIKKKK